MHATAKKAGCCLFVFLPSLQLLLRIKTNGEISTCLLQIGVFQHSRGCYFKNSNVMVRGDF